jgi:hypothetical protein
LQPIDARHETSHRSAKSRSFGRMSAQLCFREPLRTIRNLGTTLWLKKMERGPPSRQEGEARVCHHVSKVFSFDKTSYDSVSETRVWRQRPGKIKNLIQELDS